MNKNNLILVTKFNHILRLEGSSIFSDDLVWTSKMRENIVLKKLNDNSVSSFPCGDGFNQFGEIICGSEYPYMFN